MDTFAIGTFADELNYLEISESALLHNAEAVIGAVGVPVMGVLKCDGYGVSIEEAAKVWAKAGAAMFAVSEPKEALIVHELALGKDILLLAPVADPAIIRDLVKAGVILTVSDLKGAKSYLDVMQRESAQPAGESQMIEGSQPVGNPQTAGELSPIRVHLAVDTGMGRFGIRYNDIEQMEQVYQLPGLRCEGIFSHFAESFEAEYSHTKAQFDRFAGVIKALRAKGIDVGMRHIANSCAALRFPETRLDAVRIGSALVGALPVKVSVPLQRAAVYKAQVVAIKILMPGDSTGYACDYRAKRETRAAVVALGHTSGFGLFGPEDSFSFKNLLRNAYHVLKDFRRTPSVEYKGSYLPLLGRAGTQYSLFDTAGTDIQPGDYVTAPFGYLFPHSRRKFVD